MARPKKYKTEEEARQAKLQSNRQTKKILKRKENHLNKKQELFAKLLPISSTGKEAAEKAGYKNPKVSACMNLKNDYVIARIEKEEKNLKQAFKDRGLDEDYLATRFKDVIDYNQERVKKFYGEGENIREYEEMRDAKVVASTLVNVAKISGSSMELSNNVSVDVNADTAWLAIKSLIKKLSREQLGMVIDSCEALLSNDCKIVS